MAMKLVEEVKMAKRDLEDQILNAVIRFERETGCAVTSINLQRVTEIGGSEYGHPRRVDIDVPL